MNTQELRYDMIESTLKKYKEIGISVIPYSKYFSLPEDKCFSCKKTIDCEKLFMVFDGRFICQVDLGFFLEKNRENLILHKELMDQYNNKKVVFNRFTEFLKKDIGISEGDATEKLLKIVTDEMNALEVTRARIIFR